MEKSVFAMGDGIVTAWRRAFCSKTSFSKIFLTVVSGGVIIILNENRSILTRRRMTNEKMDR